MEITIDIPQYVYDKLEKEAKKYREDVEDTIMRAIEDYYG